MAAVVAELHSILHTVVHRKVDTLWADRWSFGFYLSDDTLRYARAARAARAARVATMETVSGACGMGKLASVFVDKGLPARAVDMRALQEGGWLAKRFAAGLPWPHLGDAIGRPVLSMEQGGFAHAHKRRKKAQTWPGEARFGLRSYSRLR